MKSRGTTTVELGGSLDRLLETVRRRVDPDYEQMFRCAGGCEDTGWVVSDEGVSSEGVRVRERTVRRCGRCDGRASRRTREVTGGSFS
jgi:hypothetical protein